jgi:hypothetical protein
MAVATPPRPDARAPDSGLIDDARNRQRRRRTGVAMVLAAMLAASAYLAGGSSGGRHLKPTVSGGVWPRASLPHGLSVRYPAGWHVFPPPDTSLSYPFDRVLITSYPTATGGGGCSPRRAEAALPANGALIYLFEYSTSSSFFTSPGDGGFPPEPAAFTLPGRQLNYECWTVPSYAIRFQAAGRLFQAQIALGPRVSASRRGEALRVLQSIHVQGRPTSHANPDTEKR